MLPLVLLFLLRLLLGSEALLLPAQFLGLLRLRLGLHTPVEIGKPSRKRRLERQPLIEVGKPPGKLRLG